MTRQKFYETCLMRTFRKALYDEDNPLFETMNKIGFNDDMSLEETLVKIALTGETKVPMKEDFKTWGVGYLAQLLGFVVSENDDEFSRQFFTFLKRNTTLYKKKEDRKQFGNVCFQAFVDVVVGYRELAMMLSEFIIFNFKDEDWFEDFLKCVYAFGYLTSKAQDEYEKLKYGMTLIDKVKATIDNNELKEMIK